MAKNSTEHQKDTPSLKDILSSHLKANENDHFKTTEDKSYLNYKVSSGSLKLDIELGGGFGCGAHRFVGVREGGKTSATLEVVRNFQNLHGDKAFVVYYKAEGRLSKELIERSKINTNEDCWQVIPTNIYELVVDSMRAIVKANDSKDNPNKKFCLFVIDSVDGLITRAENEKTAEDNQATASSARMLSQLFKKMSLYFSEKGHMAIFISQERSNIVINQYAPRAQTQGNSSGGNAIQHYVDFALNFKQRNKEDLILDEADDKIIGHYCKVELLKTTNDNTNAIVKYPIKRTQGIWKSREVSEILLMWEIYKKEGKWFKANKETSLFQSLEKQFPEESKAAVNFNGSKQFYEFFDNNPNITDYLYNKLRDILIKK